MWHLCNQLGIPIYKDHFLSKIGPGSKMCIDSGPGARAQILFGPGPISGPRETHLGAPGPIIGDDQSYIRVISMWRG